VRLGRFRGSIWALALAVAGWAGCATQPLVDQGFAARAYTPARIAVLPPDVFVVIDQVGDNDAAQSAALGQAVSEQAVRAAEQALRARGYDVDLSARWDGIYAGDGSLLVSRDELGALANGVVAFTNSKQGDWYGPLDSPLLVTPDLAAKVGWATQSDAVLYLNVKGAVTTPGKRAASIVAGVFIVVIAAAVVLALVASAKGGGGGGGGPAFRSAGAHGPAVPHAAPAAGWRGVPAGGAAGSGWRGAPAGGGWRAGGPSALAAPSAGGWRGGGTPGAIPRGAPVYRGGPGGVGIGVNVVVPLDGAVYTHDGNVDYDDPIFAGDELYVTMTLVSTYDGRVLWHARDQLDLEANQPADIDRMVHSFLDTLPAALPLPAASR